MQTSQANLREYKIPGLAQFVLTTRSIESDNCVLNFNHDGITTKEEFPAQSAKNGEGGKSFGQNGKNGEDGSVGVDGYDGTEGTYRVFQKKQPNYHRNLSKENKIRINQFIVQRK